MPANRVITNALRLLLLATAAGTVAAQAKDNAVTVYGAYRSGGSFVDANSNETLQIEDSGAGAVSLDFGLDSSRQVQLYLSRQKTHLGTEQPVAPGLASNRLPLTLTYLHLGGTYFFEGPVGAGPYVVGGFGATVFEPGVDGYSTEVRPSMNVGLGYQLPLGERVALRVETRGYITLVNSSGGFFCSGGCVVSVKGDSVTQAEVQLGLSFRF